MNGFQLVVVTVFGLLIARDLLTWRAGWSRAAVRLLRLGVWAGVIGAVLSPDLFSRAANALGIGRGTDFVFYGFGLAFVVAAVAQYGWNVRLERQLTQVVRHLAIAEARRGPVPPAG